MISFYSPPTMLKMSYKVLILPMICLVLSQCGTTPLATGNMGGPTIEERNERIMNEPTGNFYYGRRYFVEKTRFWGFLREPRQPWNKAKLVIFSEDKIHAPDRLPEDGPPGQAYAFDNNYEYRIRGHYTGKEVYEPNSNQFLQEFMLTGYEIVDRHPGWLFRPDDHYDRLRITMVAR